MIEPVRVPELPRSQGRGLIEATVQSAAIVAYRDFRGRKAAASLKPGADEAARRCPPRLPRSQGRGLIEAR